jgi:hypothetical protein
MTNCRRFFYISFDITICSMLIIWLECVAEIIEKHGSAVIGSSGRREAQHAMINIGSGPVVYHDATTHSASMVEAWRGIFFVRWLAGRAPLELWPGLIDDVVLARVPFYAVPKD